MEQKQTRFAELLEASGVGQTELSRWLGVKDRTIRHYVKGDRTPDSALIALLELVVERPELKQWFIARYEARKDRHQWQS